MVHNHQRWLLTIDQQRELQPGQFRFLQLAMMLACFAGIQYNDAQIVVINAVVHGARSRLVVMRAEGASEIGPIIVIAGRDQERNGQSPKRLRHFNVFFRSDLRPQGPLTR